MTKRHGYCLHIPACLRVLLLLCHAAFARAAGVDLKVLETQDLRLLYFDPQQTYLVPHVARSFQNSLEFQRRIYGWQPYDDEVTILLKDFMDYGNASASASPTNFLPFDI